FDQSSGVISDAEVAEQRRHFERESLARVINTSREDADKSADAPELPAENKNRVGETA
ncbi:MAG: hypothetical protein IZT60_10430, partial [Gammaproteobacteria bacterium]|nr:hypothetical protein [Gammaproteobacteria bacterium]